MILRDVTRQLPKAFGEHKDWFDIYEVIEVTGDVWSNLCLGIIFINQK